MPGHDVQWAVQQCAQDQVTVGLQRSEEQSGLHGTRRLRVSLPGPIVPCCFDQHLLHAVPCFLFSFFTNFSFSSPPPLCYDWQRQRLLRACRYVGVGTCKWAETKNATVLATFRDFTAFNSMGGHPDFAKVLVCAKPSAAASKARARRGAQRWCQRLVAVVQLDVCIVGEV